MHFLPKKHCFLPKKALFLPKDLQNVRKLRQILIRDKIAYVRAYYFCPSPNFSAGAPRAPAQLLPPCFNIKLKNWVLDFSFFVSLYFWIMQKAYLSSTFAHWPYQDLSMNMKNIRQCELTTFTFFQTCDLVLGRPKLGTQVVEPGQPSAHKQVDLNFF